MLKVSDVAVSRGGVPVLTGIDFDLGAGDALVLRGPNGSGKTTLLRTIAGLQPPLAGEIIGGDRVAYAAHADGLKSALTVSENLSFWSSVFGTGLDRVAAAIAAFELGALDDRRAGNLSAGQKRRLGLARLLVTGRPVWVLDEPTVSLDTASVGLFADAVRKHLGQGGAVLVATHVDLGLGGVPVLNVTAHRAAAGMSVADEAFL